MARRKEDVKLKKKLRVNRSSASYKEGARAWEDGEPHTANPHKEDRERNNWWAGFYETRVGTRLAHVFEQYKVKWP